MKEWQVVKGPDVFTHVCNLPSADGAPLNTVIRCVWCNRTYIAQAPTSAGGIIFSEWCEIDWPRESGPYTFNNGDE